MDNITNDFGRSPIGLARFLDHPGQITIATAVLGAIAASYVGPFAIVLAAWALFNDVKFVEDQLSLPAAVEQDYSPDPEVEPIDVPVVPESITVTPPQTPHITVNSSPVINIGPAGRRLPQAKTIAPPQADRRTTAPDLSLYPSPDDRMGVLLQAMAESGCPIGRLLNHPFVWCYGRSQSGKTTIAMLLSAARIAMGHKVTYTSADRDVELLNWATLHLGPRAYAESLEQTSDKIRAAGKGQLKGVGHVFDELLSAHGNLQLDLNPLLSATLEKGAKTKTTLIGISQSDTSSAHGLVGLDTAWREERASIQAIHTTDARGERSPTGRYTVNIEGDPEEWAIPEWMLGRFNQYGQPCPIVWVMEQFPELVGRVETRPPIAPPTPPVWATAGHWVQGAGSNSDPQQAAETLDPAYPAPSTGHPAPSTQQVDAVADDLLRWLEKRDADGALVGQILAGGLASLRGKSASDVRGILTELVAIGAIETSGKRYRVS
jgi:hypothetical protein